MVVDYQIASKIKSYLSRNDIKQIEVSNAVGIDKDKLSQSLNGKRKLSVNEFVAIIKFLGVSIDELV